MSDSTTGHRTFAWDGLTIGVGSAHQSALSWLEEFLAPWFEVGATRSSAYYVTLETQKEHYRELRRHAPEGHQAEADCFLLDTRVVRHPVWRDQADDLVIFDQEFEVFYSIRRKGRDIRILAENDGPGARVALMRVVRELAMSHSMCAGRLVLHGAAFAVGGNGVVVAGPKRAGKTTLLLHVLGAAGVRFVANDRVMVTGRGDRLACRGMPTIVNVRAKTLDLFPGLRARLRGSGFRHALTIAEAHRAGVASETREPDLTPAQLCALLDVEAQAGARVSALVFPRVNEALHGLVLEPLSAAIAAGRLGETVFGSASMKASTVFSGGMAGRGPDEAELRARCGDLAGEIPCFDCHLGPAPYAGASSLEGLLSLLGRSA